MAFLTLYQVDHTLGLAVGRCVHLVGCFVDSASERVDGFDMSAGLATFAVAWPVSILPGSFSDGKRSNAAT